MRRLLAALLLPAVLMTAVPGHASAQTPRTPPAGQILRLAGTGPGHLFAGTWCGVYALTADGARWAEVPGLRDVPARRLVRLRGDVLLAGTAGFSPGGVYRHEPGGTWTRVLEGLDAILAMNPSGTRAYALTLIQGGVTVLRSDDGGRTWGTTGQIPQSGSPVNIAVATNPTTGNDIVLVSQFNQRGGIGFLHRSSNAGDTWEPVSAVATTPPLVLGQIMAVDAAGSTFYLVNREQDVTGRQRRSRLERLPATGGLQPRDLPQELIEGGVSDLVAFGETVVVAGPAGVWTSVNGAAANSFRRYDEGLDGATINDLVYGDELHPPTIYAATNVGVYALPLDAGAWMERAPGLPNCQVPGRSVYEPIPAFPEQPDRRFFPETQHSLSYGFKTFWEANGGLPVFGYPLSEEFPERNVDLQRVFSTQYFERERFEYHPENAGSPYIVLLGRLGDELLTEAGRRWRDEDGTANPFPNTDCRQFDVGSEPRSVCGPFLDYWRGHGLDLGQPGIAPEESLALFGLPLTAPKLETNPDGDQVLTQWFERARFEYHPDEPEAYRVLLGRLGAEILRVRGVNAR